MNSRLDGASSLAELSAARKQYEHFICPLLDDLQDLQAQAALVSESLGARIGQFSSEVIRHNDVEVKENITAVMSVLSLSSEELNQPVCKGYYIPVATGYYRAQNTCGVYNFCDASYAGVKNPDTMNCLGGFAQVVDVPQSKFDKMTKNRSHTGHIAFNGLIRQTGRCEVYKLYDNNKYCGVANPAQLRIFGGEAAVRTISDYNSLIDGRIYTGACQG
jgi:hypothetical protein